MDTLQSFAEHLKTKNTLAYKPIKFKLNTTEDIGILNQCLAQHPHIQVNNHYNFLLNELAKVRNPAAVKNDEFYAAFKLQLNPNQLPVELLGTWCFYPWLNSLVLTLPETEFIEVRTNRNKLKITTQEQVALQSKTIGVIGLSVGSSVAITLAMERVCGTLVLADFDTLELSNLNRLKAGIHQIGLPKTIIAARHILEQDPYLKVELYHEGITENNLPEFMGKINLLVEVCDELQIKINARIAAKEKGIPVIMDTNDRGMIDIERFDLTPDLPILHGLITTQEIENLTGITPPEKLNLLLKLVSFENTSERLKTSMQEIGKTIHTWPQLASSVMLGAGSCADLCRRILLKENVPSGRFYFDTQSIMPQ